MYIPYTPIIPPATPPPPLTRKFRLDWLTCYSNIQGLV
jgi:hypothetical protein